MKNKYTLILLFFVITYISSHAQYVTIPDTTFRNDLIMKFPGCFNAAKEMDTSCVVLPNIAQNLIFINLPIKNMDGIQYFKNLTSLIIGTTDLNTLSQLPAGLIELYVSSNIQLTSLPDLPVGLNTLACQSNALTSLPTLPSSLMYLICSNNNIKILPTLPPGLKTLSCSFNPIKILPALPSTMTSIYCNSDSLSSLPTLPSSLGFLNCGENLIFNLPNLPPSLHHLYCTNNGLSNLPTLPSSLYYLDCSNNQFANLPSIPDSVGSLYCSSNLLTSFPQLPSKMTRITAFNNLLTSLPTVLPDSLNWLDVGNNQLTALPTLPHNLYVLACAYNNLNRLPVLPDSINQLEINDNANLLCMPLLPINITFFNYNNTGIACLPNYPLNCNYYPPQPPLCNPTNNVNQCQAYPQIHGLVYTDNNSNSIKDGNEQGRENIRVQLSNGAYAYTNTNGVFNITSDTIGSYNITISSPNFYNARPITYVHNFSSYNISVDDTFALKPNIIQDSLAIHITPLQNRARPGFTFLYSIKCENVGTTVLKPTIVMKYDNTQLLYDSSSISGVTPVGDSLILNADTLRQGENFTFMAYYTVKTNAFIGSSFVSRVNTNALSAYSTDSSATIITGSFDPNDKQATPEMTPSQVSSGNYIEYLIRFQNTGTDTAFSVVISDTLSNLLQKNVLQMLGTSHLCKTTLNNGIVYFEFLNIMLPDSSVNKIKSNGFVRFLIKPDSAVTLGDIIPNKASIYFDYNVPIVTNTCNTIIKNRTLPLQLISYKASLTKNRQVLNEWMTANEVNTAFFNIQRSNTGRDFKTIGKVSASSGGGRLQTYQFTDILQAETVNGNLYYRLEMWDKDGAKSYSPLQRVILSDANEISIYPNPAHDVVTIEGKDMSTISVIDNTGRLLIDKKVINSTREMLRIHQLAKGVYLLKVVYENGECKTEKLIIE